jgi:hypothetical protein
MPLKRMEKKLLKAAESRDKTTSGTQDISHDVLGTLVNIRSDETNSHRIVSSR